MTDTRHPTPDPWRYFRTAAYYILEFTALAVMVALVLLLVSCLTTGARGPSTGSVAQRAVTIDNPHTSPVAEPVNGGMAWRIQSPPEVRFTGVTATSAQVRAWARKNGIDIAFTLPDATYAQMEHESAVRAVLWLKRFTRDIGLDYTASLNDCEDFADRAQTYPTMFSQTRPEDAPGLWAIFAEMERPFAGVTDGYHALVVAWTDRGVFVFEPQGLDLTAQNLLSWPNVGGLTHAFGM